MAVELPPKATGYLIVGAIGIGLLIALAEYLKSKGKDAAKAIGFIAEAEIGPQQQLGNELKPVEVVGHIVTPASGATAVVDDRWTPQYKTVIRLVASRAAKVSYKLFVTEDPPIGSKISQVYGPFVVDVGTTPLLQEHWISRQTSLLQGSPTATMSLEIGGQVEYETVFEIGF